MRLRDAAITTEDYALWKTHELDTMDGSELQSANPCAWQGGESLVREGLVLVPTKLSGRSTVSNWQPGHPFTARQTLPARGASS